MVAYGDAPFLPPNTDGMQDTSEAVAVELTYNPIQSMNLPSFPTNSGDADDPPCKVGPCTYTIYKTPQYPPGNQCVGKKENGQPATFVSQWECIGTAANCSQKQNVGAYQDSCSAAGNTPMECMNGCYPFAGSGCIYSCECCNYR